MLSQAKQNPIGSRGDTKCRPAPPGSHIVCGNLCRSRPRSPDLHVLPRGSAWYEMNAKQILSRRVVFVVLFSLALFGAGTDKAPIHAQALNAEPELRQIAQQFFAAYADRNLDTLKSLWSTKAPDRDRFLRQFQQALSDCDSFTVENFQVLAITIEGRRANVRVSLAMNAQDRKTRRALWGFGAWQRTLRFLNEEGQWRVLQCAVSEDELAARLGELSTPAEQDALLALNAELITPDLRRALMLVTRQQRNSGQFRRAMAVADMLARLNRRTGDELWLARSWHVRGSVYAGLGDSAQAAEWYHRSEGICERLHDEEGLELLWLNLGLLHILQGEDQGDVYYRKCLALAEKLGDRLTLARVLNNLGGGLNARLFESPMAGRAGSWNYEGRPNVAPAVLQEAVAYHRKVAQLYEAANDPLGVALMNVRIGVAYSLAEENESAGTYLQLARSQFEGLNAKARLPEALEPLSMVYLKQQRYPEALEAIELALAVRAETGAPGEFSAELIAAGKIYYRLKRYDDAERVWREAVTLFEKQRHTVAGNTAAQQLFFTSRIAPYQYLTGLKAEQGQTEEALRYAEMIKGRVLFDVIHTGAVATEALLSAAERTHLDQLRNDLSALNHHLIQLKVDPQAQPEQVLEAEAKLSQMRPDYEATQATLYLTHPELRLHHGDTPLLTREEMGALVPDADTAILEYAVLDQKCLLFVLTRQPGNSEVDLQAYTIPINIRDLTAQIQEFQARLARQSFDYKEPARALYDLLLQPARAQIGGRQKLIIVPEDALWGLPFQALVSSTGKHLQEDYAISYVPSLSVLREMTRHAEQVRAAPAGRRSLLALGNPALKRETIATVRLVKRDAQLAPLPAAEKEVAALRALYGPAQSLVATREQAREGLFKTEAGRYRILHLATHGIANNARPMYSALVLSQMGDANEDGLLEAWEIAQLHLNADLVVLSACETARGRVGEGEGMIGLSWAFFLAGAPTTVVSQWSVDSKSTAKLMVEFHRQLLGTNVQPHHRTKAEALRQAALKLLQSAPTRHPFFWAGFIVVGASQ
ncbi:MAG: Tetratricopeptide 2 repeat protein [Acidobacteria bacterium]|nr:Tetratricopeptide 2 repeat protein [Acidobacteriota bacterium]